MTDKNEIRKKKESISDAKLITIIMFNVYQQKFLAIKVVTISLAIIFLLNMFIGLSQAPLTILAGFIVLSTLYLMSTLELKKLRQKEDWPNIKRFLLETDIGRMLVKRK